MRLATASEGSYFLAPDVQPLNRGPPTDAGEMVSNALHDFAPS